MQVVYNSYTLVRPPAKARGFNPRALADGQSMV